MPTDEERREVARRLRELRLKPWDDTACEIASCVGIVCCNSECHGSDETPECARALCARLADLIDPGNDHFADATKMVDRGALLELADEMDRAYPDSRDVAVEYIDDYANRIREACGVWER